ncbi:hypothetical protein HYFRA_00006876 [Hymenoscyphus fraxineus]|uniref:Diphthine--ammonia ligase n=1 Tax=Hymenoscyphus fraxineus TaxID=746836 RepID=A0A9N9KPH0_9HELO|nr:hypothetical protein HYFRA_00006876 [Hymenoscyphus fraxineus]
MSDPSLKVIALISGGKDSFFSLLHCLHHGHQVVALANLYPALSASQENVGAGTTQGQADANEEHDLNSFMYQTVGHTVIPLYEQALGIPLYRQPIVGTAVQSGASYHHVASVEEDETESLVPLLKRILQDHPTANAISTGAILSTYQRTRVESVALRLGLTPLGFLWKYPILPPGTQPSLLEDMQAVSLDARIIKVASGGLDDSFLWNNVANLSDRMRIERAIKRFGSDGDGAVLGEGGEFETLVIDGPPNLFKGRIEISDENRIIVREGGGAAWLRIPEAKVIMKDHGDSSATIPRIPDLLDSKFRTILESLHGGHESIDTHSGSSGENPKKPISRVDPDILYWTVSPNKSTTVLSVSDQTSDVVLQIQRLLEQNNLSATSITSTTILLRSMNDFATINQVYSKLFTAPNPPSRVTISVGDLLPKDTDLIIHLQIASSSSPAAPRKALHVQSRSYWAPANIGPYSQAISIPLQDNDSPQRAVSIAGQIPLIPATMLLPSPTENPIQDFALQTTLSLQHLQRIGLEMDVQYFTSAIAYIPISTPLPPNILAQIPAKAWSLLHQAPRDPDSDSEATQEVDLWESKHYSNLAHHGAISSQRLLPDFSILSSLSSSNIIPPLFIAMVEELPRQAGIEWHAHTGIAGGEVTFHSTIRRTGFVIDQCSFSGRLRSIVSVFLSQGDVMVDEKVGEAMRELGVEGGEMEAYTRYYDISVRGAWEGKKLEGVIPCSRLWDGEGRRLGAVLMFDTLMDGN